MSAPKPTAKQRYERVLAPASELIKLEPIIEILRAAIWTGKLSDEKPVSVMLIAEQESAKTEALKFFRGTETMEYLSDLTSRGLSTYKTAIEQGKLRHVVLLDLVRILAHGRGVSERTIQTMAALMEEGESSTSDGGGNTSWGKNFPKIGVLMGITTPFFKMKRGKWRQTGFLTRFVPVSFRYKDTTVDLIHAAIAKGKHTPQGHPEQLPEQPFIIACDEKFSTMLSIRAKALGYQMRSYGFRYHRILRALAKSQARISGRGYVKQEDVDKVIKWSEFFTDKEIEL